MKTVGPEGCLATNVSHPCGPPCGVWSVLIRLKKREEAGLHWAMFQDGWCHARKKSFGHNKTTDKQTQNKTKQDRAAPKQPKEIGEDPAMLGVQLGVKCRASTVRLAIVRGRVVAKRSRTGILLSKTSRLTSFLWCRRGLFWMRKSPRNFGGICPAAVAVVCGTPNRRPSTIPGKRFLTLWRTSLANDFPVVSHSIPNWFALVLQGPQHFGNGSPWCCSCPAGLRSERRWQGSSQKQARPGFGKVNRWLSFHFCLRKTERRRMQSLLGRTARPTLCLGRHLWRPVLGSLAPTPSRSFAVFLFLSFSLLFPPRLAKRRPCRREFPF